MRQCLFVFFFFSTRGDRDRGRRYLFLLNSSPVRSKGMKRTCRTTSVTTTPIYLMPLMLHHVARLSCRFLCLTCAIRWIVRRDRDVTRIRTCSSLNFSNKRCSNTSRLSD